jgi:type IV pilus assembly protein PilC
MDKAHALERRIKGALIYPAVILFVMLVIGILMFIFVVPTLMQTFTDLNVPLPATTRFILGVSNAIRDYGVLLLIGIIAVGAGIYWWAKQPTGKKLIHSTLLKVPLIGGLVQEVNAARTARTLSSLLSAGVNVVESVHITTAVVQNVHFKAVLEQAEGAIKKGELISKIFEAHTKLYPVFMAEMMSVGEETGRIGEMLSGVAHYYEEDVEQKTKDMSTVIEPFLMIVIAVAVGFFAVSMISPMYSLVDAI